MTSQRQNFCLRSKCLNKFSKRQGQYTYRQKCILKYCDDSGVLRCANGSGLFSLKTEMSWSAPIIVRECIFKSHNLCFASR